MLPSVVLLLILLHVHEITITIPSLLGATLSPATATHRVNSDDEQKGEAFTASTVVEDEQQPVVPPKEAESGVDYYMNLQAIQNLMGLV